MLEKKKKERTYLKELPRPYQLVYSPPVECVQGWV